MTYLSSTSSIYSGVNMVRILVATDSEPDFWFFADLYWNVYAQINSIICSTFCNNSSFAVGILSGI